MTPFLHEAARDFPDPFRLLVREESASTNDELEILARQGAAHGLVLASRIQTSGRGRRGNHWHAPPGENLTASILIRPEHPKALWPRLALASGLAIAETIESFGIPAGIKWPNDVWIGSRKVAGILVEAGERHAIIGIGLNVNTTQFPTDVATTATSLRIAYGAPIAIAEVLTRLVHRIAIRHRQISEDFPDLMEAIRQRCVLTGNRVTLRTTNASLAGTIEGLSDSGEILLRQGPTTHRLIQADEVRIC